MMHYKLARPYINLAAFEVIWVLSFALTGVALKTVPAPVLAAGRALVGFAFAAIAVGGRPRKKPGRGQMIWLALAGALGMSAFLLLQVLFRYSNAPSGSDVAFITGLSPLFVLPFALFWTKERVAPRQVFGIAIATLGMVAVLGNWEKPSSLWLFARFPREEVALLLSAFAWAAVTAIGRRLGAQEGVDPPTQAYYLLGFASAPLVLYALASGSLGALSGIDISGLLSLLFLGLFGTGLALRLWIKALVEVESNRVSSVLLLTPVLLSLFLIVDQKIAGLPIDLPAVAAGSVIVIIGFIAAIAGLDRRPQGDRTQGETPLQIASQILTVLSSAALLSASISLFLPVRESFISGVLDSGRLYKASWITSGYSTIGSYLLISISAYLLASALMLSKGRLSERSIGLAGVLSGLSLAFSFAVRNTPFSAWHAWMPGEVQQAIGTEYARLQEVDLTNLPLVFSSTAILIAAITAIAVGLSAGRAGWRIAERTETT